MSMEAKKKQLVQRLDAHGPKMMSKEVYEKVLAILAKRGRPVVGQQPPSMEVMYTSKTPVPNAPSKIPNRPSGGGRGNNPPKPK